MPTGPLCNCGCGEHLPEGSTRKYKRGHRQRVNRAESAAIDRQMGIFDGYNFVTEPKTPADEDIQYPDEFAGWQQPFSIQDAMDATPNDPDSDIWANVDITKELPIKALKDIEGKLAFMLGTTGGLLNVIDPICGGAFMQNTPNIAKALTPIIAQSPGVVAWFTKTSNVMLYINLAMASWPVLAAIWTHHFVKHEDTGNPFVDSGNGQMNIPTDMYQVR